jgi:hypothetical protein
VAPARVRRGKTTTPPVGPCQLAGRSVRAVRLRLPRYRVSLMRCRRPATTMIPLSPKHGPSGIQKPIGRTRGSMTILTISRITPVRSGGIRSPARTMIPPFRFGESRQVLLAAPGPRRNLLGLCDLDHRTLCLSPDPRAVGYGDMMASTAGSPSSGPGIRGHLPASRGRVSRSGSSAGRPNRWSRMPNRPDPEPPLVAAAAPGPGSGSDRPVPGHLAEPSVQRRGVGILSRFRFSQSEGSLP